MLWLSLGPPSLARPESTPRFFRPARIQELYSSSSSQRADFRSHETKELDFPVVALPLAALQRGYRQVFCE